LDKAISYNLTSEGNIKISSYTTEMQGTGFRLECIRREGTCFPHWHPPKKAAEKNIPMCPIFYALAMKVLAKDCSNFTNNGYLPITD
jgi:hypothetical protein